MEKTIRRKLEMIWEGVRSFTQRAIGSPIHIMWRWFGGTTHFRRRGGFKKIMMVPFEIILYTQSTKQRPSGNHHP